MRGTFIVPSPQEFLILFSQEGGGNGGKGGGLGDISVYVPNGRTPRGAGLFSLLAGLAKKSFPFIMKNILPEGLDMAKNVLSDVNSGSSFRNSMRRRGMKSLGNVGRRIITGGGKKRKKKKKIVKKNNKSISKKQAYNDVFSMI